VQRERRDEEEQEHPEQREHRDELVKGAEEVYS
jgi:hypothetical protein